jgi:hypothetical protein
MDKEAASVAAVAVRGNTECVSRTRKSFSAMMAGTILLDPLVDWKIHHAQILEMRKIVAA